MAIRTKRRYSRGKHAQAIDDRTGFKVKYSDLRREWTGNLVHKNEWEPKHPQLEPRAAVDAEALRNSRPEGNVDVTHVRGHGSMRGVSTRSIVGNQYDEGNPFIPIGTIPTGIASTQTIGTLTPTASAAPSGISSSISFGTFAMGIKPASIVCTISIGTETVTADCAVSPISSPAIVSVTAVGNETPTAVDLPAGIASTVSFGTLRISAWGSGTWGTGTWGD